MMLLDVGNTAVKWAVQTGAGLSGQGCFVHRGKCLAALADAAWGALPVPSAMAVANVAGSEIEAEINAWVRRHWDIEPSYIKVTTAAAGITNAYAVPDDLGVDRWAAMIAAWHQQQGAVCVVDCGSAITLDVVDASGLHQGGLIVPGVAMMRDSLSQNTADIDILPDSQHQSVNLLAKGTATAIQNGAVYMASAMVDRMVADVMTETGDTLTTYITGGDALEIQSLLRCEVINDPDLVLKGVAILIGEQT